jgi:DNA polymerase
MSSGLEAIANELRRLQRDGVNRVFVEDDTMHLLVPQEDEISPSSPQSEQSTAPSPSVKTSTQNAATPQTAATPKVALLPEPPIIELPDGDATSQLAWLKDRVLACEVCKEHLDERGKIVFGTGSAQADIFFCGEAPDADEAREGEAFVGKSGQLLSKITRAMGLTSESVYTTNILKWRPEHNKPYGNRPPTLDEMRFCLPYLKAQIEIIQPKVIVALGNTTVSGLFGHDPERKMAAVRGTWDQFEAIPVIITFHPSYLLRNGTLKTRRIVWEDMLKVMEKCSLEISDQQRGFFLPRN